SLAAAIDTSASDLYTLRFSVPTGVQAGVTYNAYLSNGMGGSYGEVLAPQELTARGGGADPFGLSVPSGADYTFHGNVYNVRTDSRLSSHATGNGTTNDVSAIQAAITTAHNAGGGV